jgi:hypothetical protein
MIPKMQPQSYARTQGWSPVSGPHKGPGDNRTIHQFESRYYDIATVHRADGEILYHFKWKSREWSPPADLHDRVRKYILQLAVKNPWGGLVRSSRTPSGHDVYRFEGREGVVNVIQKAGEFIVHLKPPVRSRRSRSA